MVKAAIAQKGPYKVEVQAGKKYFWCACGLSKAQPFCDGSHSGTGITSVMFEAAASGSLYLCGCKQSKKSPFCDSSHNAL